MKGKGITGALNTGLADLAIIAPATSRLAVTVAVKEGAPGRGPGWTRLAVRALSLARRAISRDYPCDEPADPREFVTETSPALASISSQSTSTRPLPGPAGDQ